MTVFTYLLLKLHEVLKSRNHEKRHTENRADFDQVKFVFC